MNEQYVSFEVSKLLKENGFDWFTYSYYTKDDVDEKPYFGMENLCPDNWNGEVDEVNDLWFSAPTQQMACRWLRKEKGIHILPEISEVKENPKYYCMIWKTSTLESFIIELFDSYEDAIEAALQYVLTNLI